MNDYCRRAAVELEGYLTEELPRARMAGWRAHLEQCGGCGTRLEQLRLEERLLMAVRPEVQSPSEEVFQAIFATAVRQSGAAHRRRPYGWAWAVPVAVLLGVASVHRLAGGPPSGPAVASARPIRVIEAVRPTPFEADAAAVGAWTRQVRPAQAAPPETQSITRRARVARVAPRFRRGRLALRGAPPRPAPVAPGIEAMEQGDPSAPPRRELRLVLARTVIPPVEVEMTREAPGVSGFVKASAYRAQADGTLTWTQVTVAGSDPVPQVELRSVTPPTAPEAE
jgi:hypothetical protein